MTSDIIVVGKYRAQPHDQWVVDSIALWLADNGLSPLGEALLDGAYDSYDMTFMPTKGDAIDAIGSGTKLVVALHLYGIDTVPGGRHDREDGGYLYNKKNGLMLTRCTEVGAMLACWGDQPSLLGRTVQKIEIASGLFLYRENSPGKLARLRQLCQKI